MRRRRGRWQLACIALALSLPAVAEACTGLGGLTGGAADAGNYPLGVAVDATDVYCAMGGVVSRQRHDVGFSVTGSGSEHQRRRSSTRAPSL
jgi:hypothetical protein